MGQSLGRGGVVENGPDQPVTPAGMLHLVCTLAGPGHLNCWVLQAPVVEAKATLLAAEL